jgi:hypothetical protein
MRADALFLVPAVAAAAAALELRGRRTTGAVPATADQMWVIDPRTGAIFASVSVPGGPSRLATDGSCGSEATPLQIDLETRSPATVLAPGAFPSEPGAGRRLAVDDRRAAWRDRQGQRCVRDVRARTPLPGGS